MLSKIIVHLHRIRKAVFKVTFMLYTNPELRRIMRNILKMILGETRYFSTFNTASFRITCPSFKSRLPWFIFNKHPFLLYRAFIISSAKKIKNSVISNYFYRKKLFWTHPYNEKCEDNDWHCSERSANQSLVRIMSVVIFARKNKFK